MNDEAKERISEFEIIRNDEIDYISLNNLFDFYEIDYLRSMAFNFSSDIYNKLFSN